MRKQQLNVEVLSVWIEPTSQDVIHLQEGSNTGTITVMEPAVKIHIRWHLSFLPSTTKKEKAHISSHIDEDTYGPTTCIRDTSRSLYDLYKHLCRGKVGVCVCVRVC